MNRAQKIAIFNLVVFGCTLLTTAVAMGVSYHYLGWPRAARCFGLVGLGGIAGLAPLIFKKDRGAVAFDERDKLIHRTAALSGFMASYLWLCLTGTVFALLFKPAFFKTFGLPTIVFGSMFVVVMVRSIAVLVLYGRSHSDE